MDTILVAAAGPVISGVMAGIGFWLRQRLQRRNRQLADREARQQASEQVAFIESWLRVHAQLAESAAHGRARDRALADLEKAYAFVDQSLDSAPQHEPPSVRTVLPRILLLDHPARTRGARVAAALYYFSLAWLVLWLAAGVLFGGAVAVSDSGDVSVLEAGVTSFGLFLLSLAIGLAPVLPLYHLASSAERLPLPALSDAQTL